MKLLKDFLKVMLGLNIQRGSICLFCVRIGFVICCIFLFLLIIIIRDLERRGKTNLEVKELKLLNY